MTTIQRKRRRAGRDEVVRNMLNTPTTAQADAFEGSGKTEIEGH